MWASLVRCVNMNTLSIPALGAGRVCVMPRDRGKEDQGKDHSQVLQVQLILDQQPVAEWPENQRIADEDSWGVEWETCRQDAQ